MVHVRLRALLLMLSFVSACSRGPSRDEALAALRVAQPAMDSATVRGLVWRDGPPWFSCAEVASKFTARTDSAAVRDQVGNWKPLLGAGWAILRDTASGVVADPGWCTVKPTSAGQPRVSLWTPVTGATLPTGQPRRGWTMVVGRRRIVVPASPSAVTRDSAVVRYLVTVAPTIDGVAVGADRDTSRFVAALHRVQGAWRVAATNPVPTTAAETSH